jgi:hypothetical protein
MRFQEGGVGDIATVMVICVKDEIPVHQQLFERGPVTIKRDIQHGDAAGDGIGEPIKERDVSLNTGDESCLWLRLVQTELLQGADAIRITIENIDTVHE